MAYHDELLRAAYDLVLQPDTQGTLRRAVSTAYYAVFHLLIYESCQLWVRPEHRQSLSRQFDHTPMKIASRLVYEAKFKSPATLVEASLVNVATTFVQLRQKRHDCDYDLSFTLSVLEASNLVQLASVSFEEWEKIRTEQIAKDYLYALLFKEHRR
jgi:uncharacterized protein (UPF0332 family)